VQSSVEDRDRSEAGGLQNTAQQLGSSLGTAVLGAIVITGLISAFTTNVATDPALSADVEQKVEVRVASGASFVNTDQVRSAAEEEGLNPAETDNVVDDYAEGQLQALKIAFLSAALLVLAS